MGDLSKNFSRREFRCPHCGRLPPAGVHPDLVQVLQRLRDLLGRPLRVLSGYRCPEHNRRVGGARYSQHMYGRAADIEPLVFTERQARAAGARGVGLAGGRVRHVDVRTGRPATWHYR